MDLKDLITACKKHDLKAQSQLYQKYKDELFVLSLKYCKNKEQAEDNLQDAFIDILKKIKTFRGEGAFEGWMKRIVINKAIDKYKKESKTHFEIAENLSEDVEVETGIIESISVHQLLKHIQDLPSQYRLVFNLYELDEYSHKDISKLLGISINTSKSNLHRAKKILQSKITPVQVVSTKLLKKS